MIKMSTAETRAYQQLCDPHGRMLVVACDQRGSMRALLTSTPEDRARISDSDLGDVKADLVRYLGDYAPCVLLDPICALPQVIDDGVLARDVALLVGMDASGWETDRDTTLRRSLLVPGISARRIRQLGGTAGKLLVYMRPDREGADGYPAGLIRQEVADCAAEDLLLVVEILVYQLDGESPDSYEAHRPSLILEAARIAADSGAKVLKLQYPGSAEACAAVTQALGNIPWALLSAGVDHETFMEQLRVALEHGAAGAIVGRALWKDCVSLDATTRRERMQQVGLPRLREVQALLVSSHVRALLPTQPSTS